MFARVIILPQWSPSPTNATILDGYLDLYCKLTDFGVSNHPSGKVVLGGSRPWQAPECLLVRGELFELEDARRTDVYSFGMLVWRVVVDGDPFKLLEESLR